MTSLKRVFPWYTAVFIVVLLELPIPGSVARWNRLEFHAAHFPAVLVSLTAAQSSGMLLLPHLALSARELTRLLVDCAPPELESNC